ncbi:MAG TPA: ABC transporter ATP-binding protein [Dehalococcoidia bacterium]|nr:ABC transporter ATP-binding protein [Dehalococcoidia bacterium]
MTPTLLVEHVVSGYGEVEVLHGVTVRVEPGEIVSIIGPNGAGKSTLMKAAFGLLPIKRGRVLLQGQDVTGRAPNELVRLGMAYVPQVDNVFPSLTIQENLEMGAWARGDGFKERLARVYDLFPALAARPHEKASRLSGGQRQLLAIGRALMLDPIILLLDEPSASLSPKMVDLVFENIIEINARGTAILMVEQNARHALSLSHRAYVLATGENRLEGDAKALLDSEEVRRLYLGE